MKAKYELTHINGDLTKELLAQGTIVACEFDGFDFHILVKRKSGTEYNYAVLRTMIYSSGSPTFYLMKEYNRTPKQAEKAFYDYFYEAVFYNEKHENNSKYLTTKTDIINTISKCIDSDTMVVDELSNSDTTIEDIQKKVDALYLKVGTSGTSSLTDDERNFLTQYS